MTNQMALVQRGKSFYRAVLKQPPALPHRELPVDGPTAVERLALRVLGESHADLARHIARNGITRPVGGLPDPKATGEKNPAGVSAPRRNCLTTK